MHFAIIFGYSIYSDVIPPLMDLQPCDAVFSCCFQRLETAVLWCCLQRLETAVLWRCLQRLETAVLGIGGTPEAKIIGVASHFFSRKGSHHILALAKPPGSVAHTSQIAQLAHSGFAVKHSAEDRCCHRPILPDQEDRPVRGILEASQNLSWNRLQEEIALCPAAAM